jgi:cytochrome c biogenesis protein CcmG, thiol:disulfide interchange protein DsbE
MNRWHLFFVALLIAGPLWLWSSRLPVTANQGELTPEPAVGRPAPDFTLTTVAGETVQLSALRGQPVVLNFWATWCGPCRNEMPALEAASQRFAGEVAFMGVDQGESQAVVAAYLDELGVTFTVPLDSDMAVGDRYHVGGLPTTYFVDAEGIIRHMWMGEMNAVVLAEGVAKIWP